MERSKIINHFKRFRVLYIMLVPAILWYIIFCYGPMGGSILAFKNYRYDQGIIGSPWIGLENFEMMFKDSGFNQAFKNTIILSLGKIIFGFPVPIVTALLINEFISSKLKKFFQTLFTFPHFISWVVLSSIFITIFSSNGTINQILNSLGVDSFMPLITPSQFRPFIWLSSIWKEFGWESIIYLAAIAGIDQQLYEAATIDGATSIQKTLFITLPSILPIISIMLILQIGNVMGATSFNQVFNLYSPPVYNVGDIIDTYVQRNSFLVGANFGYTTAVGLFKSIINFIMLFTANKIVTKFGQQGLF